MSLFRIMKCRFTSQFFFFLTQQRVSTNTYHRSQKFNKWAGKLNRSKKLTCILQQVHPALVIGLEPTIIQHNYTLSLPCKHFSNAFITHLHDKTKKKCNQLINLRKQFQSATLGYTYSPSSHHVMSRNCTKQHTLCCLSCNSLRESPL